ncbi:unnamed protein product [Kluyveromyces dobzhanskii CBS 2104]|uniref:WGS project CCBQ000000000 data, contig 00102 n=1 Tax=Kluyveromyces dobzhanskii CBS 2104 TaxID=1427455 RepID=A0A0A8L6J1_9SACH|nr:unnamed protein product [Kluyveromyces dobzhanskii CBS 2104]
MIDGQSTKTAYNANSLYQFLKSLEPLSMRQPISIMHSNIQLDQKLVSTLSRKPPNYAAATLSQSYKIKAPLSNARHTTRSDIMKRCKSMRGISPDNAKIPEFCSVFKPPAECENEALSNGTDWRASINKIFLREPRSATCECSSKYVTAEFSQRFRAPCVTSEELTQEFNRSLLSELTNGSVSEATFKLVKDTLAENERCMQVLKKECSNSKQLVLTLQSTLTRIQSLCDLYY